ncbi:MAG TPA: hypothetical protein VL576_00605 [Candidatus Paceibacterota bacterium]|nr:hypothetical protein [Candidatus Paceibacterota bacterium]
MLKKILSAVLALSVIALTISGALIAHAASLTALSDTMSNQTISALSSHTIKFTTPTGVTASTQTIVVTFPSGFVFTSKTIASLSLTYGASTGLETTATLAASPGATTTWGAVFSGTSNVILTLTAPTSGTYIAAGNKVILTYDSTNSTNPSSATNYAISIATSTGDSGSITVPIITNSQVAVTATVSQTLSFSISSNSIGFGTLSTGASTYANAAGTGTGSETSAHTLAASTNGTSGYTIAISGDTLKSGSNSITALGASPTALSPGSSQFGIRATASGGTGAVSSPFNGSSGSYGFGTTPPLSNVAFATASGATATTTYSNFYAANISPTTPAGSYSTTLTYVATANF